MEFEILDMCRFRILTRITARHTPLKSNNKWYLKCAVFLGKQDTSFYPKTSDSDSLSFVGSVFFSCVSACFNFDLSNLVTSSRFGLSAIVESSWGTKWKMYLRTTSKKSQRFLLPATKSEVITRLPWSEWATLYCTNNDLHALCPKRCLLDA